MQGKVIVNRECPGVSAVYGFADNTTHEYLQCLIWSRYRAIDNFKKAYPDRKIGNIEVIEHFDISTQVWQVHAIAWEESEVYNS